MTLITKLGVVKIGICGTLSCGGKRRHDASPGTGRVRAGELVERTGSNVGVSRGYKSLAGRVVGREVARSMVVGTQRLEHRLRGLVRRRVAECQDTVDVL